MITEISNLSDNRLKIGDVFTPQKWAEFAVEKYYLLDEWLSGKTIFDPTMGEGNLLFILPKLALEKGVALEKLPFKNLYGNEMNSDYYEKAIKKFKNSFNVDMRENFRNSDFLEYENKEFDILFGNPPWCNFTDLPNEYKEQIKKYFFEYNLIENSKKLLLGGARIDIAALIIQKATVNNLKENGKSVFFLPLSLFFNDGVHKAFKRFNAKNKIYYLNSIYDFDKVDAFIGISTRYGIASFTREKKESSRVSYYNFENNEWHKKDIEANELFNPVDVPKITVSKKSKPRQGINPCGAIDVFVFKDFEKIDENICLVNKKWALPKKFVYPLITSNNFKDCDEPQKWVLLPYNNIGKPLTEQEVKNEQLLFSYLQNHKEKLTNRKGTIIQAQIKRGIWWALLGVGAYNFSPYKIVWEAYGKSTFNPQIFRNDWQVNQSLQAFIPCAEQSIAEQILEKLQNPKVEEYLHSFKAEGTMNWAQPGKISSILEFVEYPSLFN